MNIERFHASVERSRSLNLKISFNDSDMVIALQIILDWATCASMPEEISKLQTTVLALISLPCSGFIPGCTYTILVAY